MTVDKLTAATGSYRWLYRWPLGMLAWLLAKPETAAEDGEIRIYAHSSIIYWWPVWFYAAICWGATVADHIKFSPPGLKEVNIFPSPWLGMSFLCVLFFVIAFSNMKVRGFHALLVAMAVGLLAIGIHWLIGLDWVFGKLQLLFVFANEGFYGAVAVFMLFLWSIVVFGIDHMTYYRFTAGQVIEEQTLGHVAGVAFDAGGMIVRPQASDFFRHKILGLAFLGLGTGDFICKPSASGADPLVLENVVQLSRKLPRIEKIISLTTVGAINAATRLPTSK
jgi:hypothetical protein